MFLSSHDRSHPLHFVTLFVSSFFDGWVPKTWFWSRREEIGVCPASFFNGWASITWFWSRREEIGFSPYKLLWWVGCWKHDFDVEGKKLGFSLTKFFHWWSPTPYFYLVVKKLGFAISNFFGEWSPQHGFKLKGRNFGFPPPPLSNFFKGSSPKHDFYQFNCHGDECKP